MKKLVLFFAVIVAVSFASCGNKPAEAPAEEVVATEEVAVEEAPVAAEGDSAVVEAPVEAAPAQ